MTAFWILIVALGLIVLFFGNRMVIFAAGVGALLGIVILRILPGAQDGILLWVVPIGLAVLFAIGSGIAKGVVSLITLVIGALAGAAIVMAVLDLFGLDLGLLSWVLAFVGALVCAGLFSRFEHWVVIILAALVGALLTVRGLQNLVPFIQGYIASLLGLVLAGGAIAYHGGFFGKGKTT